MHGKALSQCERELFSYSEGVEESERKEFKLTMVFLVSYVKHYIKFKGLKNLKIIGELTSSDASAEEFPKELKKTYRRERLPSRASLLF